MRLYFIGGHHIFLELCFYKKEPQAPNGGQIQKMLKSESNSNKGPTNRHTEGVIRKLNFQ